MDMNESIPMPSNGPSELPPSLRRLRHLKRIMFYNIDSRNKSYDTCFTLHEDHGSADLIDPFYTSEVIFESSNPQWRTFSIERLNNPSLKHQNKFVICIWDVKSKPTSQLLLMRLNMGELMYITTLEINFPSNTLIFELHDGYYITKQVRYILEETKIITRRDLYVDVDRIKKVSLSYSVFSNIIQKQKELEMKKAKVSELASRIKTNIDRKDELFKVLNENYEKKDMSMRLKAEYEYQNEIFMKEKADYEERKKNLNDNRKYLLQASIALELYLEDIEKEKSILLEKQEELKKINYLIKKHTAHLIANLGETFKITKNENDEYSINGFIFPNSDYDNYDEEIIATALGHACHLVKLLSKYLDVPLRYNIISMMSRSRIVDGVKNNVHYPLYSKGQDKNAFIEGISLLMKNIEQLLASQGIKSPKPCYILPSLKLLMDHFIKG